MALVSLFVWSSILLSNPETSMGVCMLVGSGDDSDEGVDGMFVL